MVAYNHEDYTWYQVKQKFNFNHVNWQTGWQTLPNFLSVFKTVIAQSVVSEDDFIPWENTILYQNKIRSSLQQAFVSRKDSSTCVSPQLHSIIQTEQQNWLVFFFPYACTVIFGPLKIYLWYHKCMKICTETEITWLVVYTKVTNKTSRGNSIYRQTWAQYTLIWRVWYS